MSNPDQSPASPEYARLLAEQVLAMDMVTDRGIKARELARAVLEAGHESPAELALRSLASWLGVGGYNSLTIDAKVMENRIRDGISAERSSEAAAMAATVPAGYALVPQVLTKEMLYEVQENAHILPPRAHRIWNMLLAAAPQAPVADQPAEPTPAASPVTLFGHALSYSTKAERSGSAVLSAAARAVLAERARQINAEGWTTEHDDEHDLGQLARAGAAYAAQSLCAEDAELKCGPPSWWPWERAWWKPNSRRGMLVKAGALILAEIERLDRAAPKGDSNG